MQKRLALVACCFIAFMVMLLVVAGCGGSSTKTQTGKFTKVHVTIGLSDAVSGKLTHLGISTTQIVITKSNGEDVQAFVPKDMVNSLRGQQTLEIKQIKGTDKWVVSKILKQP